MGVDSDLIRGHVETIILNILASGDKYGYEIIDEVTRRSNGTYELKQPTLYSCLKRMESQELISSYWLDSDIGGRRHYYKLTEKGRDTFEQNQNDWINSRSIIDSLISSTSTFSPTPTPVVSKQNDFEENQTLDEDNSDIDNIITKEDDNITENENIKDEEEIIEKDKIEETETFLDEEIENSDEMSEPHKTIDADNTEQTDWFSFDTKEEESSDVERLNSFFENKIDETIIEDEKPEEITSDSFDFSKYLNREEKSFFEANSDGEAVKSDYTFSPLSSIETEDTEKANGIAFSLDEDETVNFVDNSDDYEDEDDDDNDDDEKKDNTNEEDDNTEVDDDEDEEDKDDVEEKLSKEETHYFKIKYDDDDDEEDNKIEDIIEREELPSLENSVDDFSGQEDFVDTENILLNEEIQKEKILNNSVSDINTSKTELSTSESFSEALTQTSSTLEKENKAIFEKLDTIKAYTPRYTDAEYKNILGGLTAYGGVSPKPKYNEPTPSSNAKMERDFESTRISLEKEGITVKLHSKREIENPETKTYVLTNKIKMASSWFVFFAMIVALAITYIVCFNTGYFVSPTSFTNTGLYFVVAASIMLLIPLIYSIEFYANPMKKHIPRYASRASLLFSFVFTALSLLIIYTVNLSFGMYSFNQDGYNNLNWLVPAVCSLIFIISSITYSIMFRSKKFHI